MNFIMEYRLSRSSVVDHCFFDAKALLSLLLLLLFRKHDLQTKLDMLLRKLMHISGDKHKHALYFFSQTW